jgi:PAS domain S-box-containing protein
VLNSFLDPLAGSNGARKDSGPALAQAPQNLAEVLESISDAFFALDRRWRFTYLNGAAERLLQRTRGELLGRNLWEEFPQAVGSSFEKEYRRAAAERVTVEFEEHYAPLQTWFAVRAYPTATGLSVYFQNVTERRRTEEALRESEERHRLVSELTSDCNYVLRVAEDGTSHLELATDGLALVTGYTLDEVNACGGWPILIHPEDKDNARRFHDQVRSGKDTASVLRIVTKAGATRWVRNLNKPVWDAAGRRVVRIIGASQDITDRMEAEAELRDSRQRLQALSRQLMAAQEKERRHLAHELHDEVGQTLTAISVNLHAATRARGEAAQAHLREAIAIVDQALEQVRHLSLDLRPSILDDLGLEAALRWYADRTGRRTGLTIHLDSNFGGCRLPAELETTCFRIAQEALTNVVRHAAARRVWIELQHRGLTVELHVRDDGIGFDPIAARKQAAAGASFGLLGMQERVDLLGGELTIESRPAQGTSIHARFVLHAMPRA